MSRVYHDQTAFEVKEDGTLCEFHVVDAHIRTETRWTCPSCKTSWAKKGAHLGVYKRCRCGQGFWLRAAT